MDKPKLENFYKEKVVPALVEKFGFKNCHQFPKIEKVVINSSVKTADAKAMIQQLLKDVAAITGQAPVATEAKKSISNFKLREGMAIGVKTTLRGARMYDFLLRFLAIALPAIRDFRGLSNKFDGSGNITIGVTDHTIFPEVSVVSSTQRFGLDVTIVTSADSDEEGKDLLKLMQFPFRKAKTAEELVS